MVRPRSCAGTVVLITLEMRDGVVGVAGRMVMSWPAVSHAWTCRRCTAVSAPRVAYW